VSDHSAIEWTDATWNPVTGCTKVSPGCAHCYIERTPPFRISGRRFVHGTIPLELHDDRLEQPLHWRTPRRIRDQCLAAHVPFFFKQWGGRLAKSGGRELDRRTWDEMPADSARCDLHP
jgi:protein gp37